MVVGFQDPEARSRVLHDSLAPLLSAVTDSASCSLVEEVVGEVEIACSIGVRSTAAIRLKSPLGGSTCMSRAVSESKAWKMDRGEFELSRPKPLVL